MSTLVVCSEIGSAVALSKVLEIKKITSFYLLATNLVSEYFLSQDIKFQVIEQNNIPNDIDLILLGSTIGPCLERDFYIDKKFNDLYKISVIDSYWNIHQRFANEISGSKWEYIPDEIYVPNLLISKSLTLSGFKGKISLFDSPSFIIDNKKAASLKEIKEIRAKYGIKINQKVFIFISEYYQKTPDNWQIDIDQYDYIDIQYSLDLFSKNIDYLNSLNNVHVPFIKWHPTREDKKNLKIPLNLKKNELQSVTKEELFMLGDIFVGINSMLLLEAYNRGFEIISFMSEQMNNKKNLANFFPKIHQTDDVKFKL